MSNIISYLQTISFRMSVLKKTQSEYERQLSSKFNVFDYIYLDENRMSDIFANLLRPLGNHSQGSIYLDSFLEILGVYENFNDIIPKVEREVQTYKIENNRRRIDIVISWDEDFAIGIENKPSASDGWQQLKDYSEHLAKKYKNYLLLYLSESPPEEYSISKEDIHNLLIQSKYKHITYSKEIENWLKKCIDYSQSEKMRYFLKDFRNTLKNTFSIMPTENSNEIVQYALSSTANLEAAYEAYKAFPLVTTEIAKNFSKKLEEKLRTQYDDCEIRNETYGDRVNILFRKKSWVDETYCSVKDTHADRVYLAVETEASRRKDFYYTYLKGKINGKPNDYQWWDHPTKYNRWMGNIDEIKLMESGVAVDFFFEQLSKLILLVDEYPIVSKKS